MTASVYAIRQFYAEELLAVCNLQSAALVRALATVPRERFLGPGPWRIRGMDGMFLPGATGSYTAPFTGIHGWYWQNRTDKPVTLKLSATGFFTESQEFRRGHAPRSKKF